MAVALSPTPIPSVHDEPRLVAATRAGDARAFEVLYARYRERIFAFILGRVHDHARAEDIAQDVFISALRRLREGDQEIAFKPWIYEIAKNACIDEFRRGHRSREVPLETDSESLGERPAALSALSTPAAAAETKQRMDDLRGAFGGLSETHHRLLVLREFEGLSYDEIGARLGMSRQMVESGLFRARRKLTEEYRELASGRRCEQVQSAIEAGTLASARTLGLRARRRFARHLSHCQTCRQVALMTGVDEALVRPRSIPAKIAALLPFPFGALRWPWGQGSGGARASVGSHPLTTATMQNAPLLVEQAGSSGMAPAAVAAAALAIAGVGGGLVVNSVGSGHGGRSAAVPSSRAAHRSVSHRPAAASPSSTVARLRAAHARSALRSTAAAVRGGSATARSGQSRPHATSSRPSGASSAGSPTAPVKSVATAAGSATHQATSTAQNVVSTTTQRVSSSTQQAVSGVRQAVSGATGTVSKVTGGVTNSVSQATGSVTNTVSKTVQGATNTVKQATSAVSAPASGASSGQSSGAGSSLSSAVSGATAPVTQAAGQATQTVGQATQTVGQATQSVGQTAQGLLH